ncbi:MAG: hypothetical protein ACK5KN_11510 [Dysgonomonas sp.]|uniref:hypothetical protein n=1 Tax=Dysgonomonas sp. TaxID=1891233 RepID=UPI003A851DD8
MRILSFIVLIILSVNSWAQDLKTEKITDWNTLRKPGFYESNSSNIINAPTNTDWFWGINIAHSTNADAVNVPYHYGAQILFPIKNVATMVPEMYIRSINKSGEGMWAKVLHDQGNQVINGNLVVNTAFTVGNQISTNPGSINRLTIIPYRHTGGPWQFISRDTSGEAYLDFNYGINKIITIRHDHKVGILTQNPSCALDVAGTIRSKEVKIEATGWSDFVFNKNYDLPKLSEVEKHINEKQHLPGIPSEKEVLENGISVGEMQAKLLQKIEELTLYIIEQDKQNKDLQKQIDELKVQLKNVQP